MEDVKRNTCGRLPHASAAVQEPVEGAVEDDEERHDGRREPKASARHGRDEQRRRPGPHAVAPAEVQTRYLQRFNLLSEAAGFAPSDAAFDTE